MYSNQTLPGNKSQQINLNIKTSADANNSLESPPEDQLSKAVATCKLTKVWRASASIQETRYVLKTPSADMENNLTANALVGDNKLPVPPFVFIDDVHGSLYAFYYLGSGLAGHRGMLHGGVFAILLDECMGRASFAVLPNHIAVTASMEIAYKAPICIPAIVVICAKVEKVEGRKAWIIASIEQLDGGSIPRYFFIPRHRHESNVAACTPINLTFSANLKTIVKIFRSLIYYFNILLFFNIGGQFPDIHNAGHQKLRSSYREPKRACRRNK
jgi:hypothetical protein